MSITDRETLQDIRAAAESMVEGSAPLWAAAYRNLALAADHLDAMWARTTIFSTDEEERHA